MLKFRRRLTKAEPKGPHGVLAAAQFRGSLELRKERRVRHSGGARWSRRKVETG